VNVGPSPSRAAWVEKARRIEALGYDVLTFPDHLSELLAPMPAVVAAAEATTAIRVGANVLNNDFRHPVLVAREAATADFLTGGRFLLGLGAGHVKAEYDEAGLVFDKGGVRVERLAEAIAIVKGLMTGAPFTFTGNYYHLTNHRIHPPPVQEPRPPLAIAGNGRQLLTLAAREADIIGFSGITFRRGGTFADLSAWKLSGVDQRIRFVREVAGDRFAQLELNPLVQRVVVVDDRRRAAEELARHWTQLTPEEILESPFVLVGTITEMVDDLLTRRERWGFSYVTIFEPYLDAFAPVVDRLRGK
jgi:probable F420-dependent oxidoreductase